MSIVRPYYALNTTIPAQDFPLRLGVNASLWLDGLDASTLFSDGAASFSSPTNQYLSRTGATSTTLTTGDVDWWLSTWHYNTTVHNNTYRGIFGKHTGSGTTNVDFDLCANRYFGSFLTVGNGTNKESVSFSQIPINTWGHYFCTKIGNVLTISLRYSGTLYSNSLTLTYTPAAGTGNLHIGGVGNPSVGYATDGYIDSCAFGKPSSGWLASNATALRDYLYNSGNGRRSSEFKSSSYFVSNNPSGAISWWDLDEKSGTRYDRIGTNHLTDNNSVGFDAGVPSGLVQFDGDSVSTWQDKSGNARHATTNSGAARPLFKLGSGVQLDGINDFLTTPSYAKGPNYTIVAVIKATDSAARDGVISSASGVRTLRYGNNTSFQSFTYNQNNAPSTNASYPVTTTNVNIVTLVVDTQATLYTNGQKALSAPVSGTGISGSVATLIGSSGSAGFLKGTILHYIEYETALTDAQRLLLENYFVWKYNISPYPQTSNTKAYLNYFAGDPGLGVNENWNLAFGSYPLNVVQGFLQ